MAEAASKEASSGASSRIRTRSRSAGDLRLFADSRLRWHKTRTHAGRFGCCPVAAWFVTVRQNKSVTLIFLSRSTGVSSRALVTVTVKTLLLPRRQPSISCRVSGKSQTPLMCPPQTRQHRRRQLDGEDQEKPWKSDRGTRPERSTTDKDWHRPEDGLPRNADTQRRHCGRQLQKPIMDFTRRPWVKSHSRRLKKGSGEAQEASCLSSGRAGAPLEPTTRRQLAQRGGGSGGQPQRLRSKSPCRTGNLAAATAGPLPSEEEVESEAAVRRHRASHHSSYQLGISQRRAARFIKWTRTTAEQETVHMAKFEEGLGRVMYVTGALEHERPYTAPLCKFMTIHPRHSVQAVPSYVACFLRCLADQVERTESWCTGVGRANRNRRLASSVWPDGSLDPEARKLAVGV